MVSSGKYQHHILTIKVAVHIVLELKKEVVMSLLKKQEKYIGTNMIIQKLIM